MTPDININQKHSKYLNSRTKRCFDIIISLIFLPSIFICISLLTLVLLIIEGRPVFFVHKRIGQFGKAFKMPKLRTLHTRANPSRPSIEIANNPLVTRTGNFLRKHRLDELPQFFSVLVGDMTLVGPRPEIPEIVEIYENIHKERLQGKPGITGLWQILGDRNSLIHENLEYDIYYLCNATIWLDTKILFLTIPFMLNPKWKNIYENWLYTDDVSVQNRDLCSQGN